ncbi:MAG: TIGR04282 family arsenosugar biosynthesis glycosyltransferase [Microcystaceae cyanobacterium]
MTALSPTSNHHLVIIFTRYPEAGKTKTRMIPVLSAQGAANLQRQMTEHTLTTVTQLQQEFPVRIAIFYTGGTLNLVKSWLQNECDYVDQGEGDLGVRLSAAFQNAFEQGREKVLIIGIDCPEITPTILRQGFEALSHHDLVLGPAIDGGYYLIGTRRWIPELFKGITWGTGEVLKETKAIAAQLSLNTVLLPQLADVDRPEDLGIWQKFH